MKVAMVVHDLNVSGGIHKLVLRFAQELKRGGHSVIVYTLSADKKKCYPDIIKKVNVVSLYKKPFFESDRFGKLKIIFFGPFTYLSRFKQLSKKMDGDFDGLVIHDPLSLYTLLFYKSTKTLRTVWMLNNQLPKHYGHIGRVIDELRPALSGFRIFMIKVSSFPAIVASYVLEKKTLRRVDKFAVYDSHNQRLVKKYLNKEAVNVFAGADLEIFKRLYPGRNFKMKATFRILSVGIVAQHRRYQDLLRAVSMLVRKNYSVQLTIVGVQTLSPDYFKELEILTEKLKLEEIVTFIDRVSDQDMMKLYKDATAFVFINDAETWGVSVLEAVAAGLPVVITDNIGAADLVTKEYGWIVKPRKPRQVEAALKKIIDNPNTVKRMVEKAFKEVAPKVTWKAYSKRMLALIKASDE